jgi:PAS domain S-box-containing protein
MDGINALRHPTCTTIACVCRAYLSMDNEPKATGLWPGSPPQEREHLLHLIARAAKMGIWSRDLRTDRAEWSSELYEIFGITPDQFDGSSSAFLNLIHSEDRPVIAQALREVAEQGTDFSQEFRIRHASGEIRWIAGLGRAAAGAEGKPIRFYGVAMDVTERKRVEIARARLAAIVECSDDAIISKGLDGIITSWNQGAERIYGYRAEEMIGVPITRIIPEELHQEEDDIIARLKRGERIDHFETVRVTKSGQRIDVSITISPIRDSSGRIVGASKVARDIGAMRQAERALRDEAHALETLNRIGRVLSAELDLERIIQAATDAATELAGAAFGAFFYNVHEQGQEAYWLYTLSGVSRELFARFPMPRSTALFGPTFKGEGVVRSDNIRQDPRYGHNSPYSGMPAGHLPVCSYLAVPVISRTGAVIGGLFFGHPQPAIFTERSERLVVGIAAQAAIAIDNARLYQGAQQELAARKAVETALRESEAKLRAVASEREVLLESERVARSEAERLSHMKDEFLATLSHELRTPLNAIQGWSSLLRQPNLAAEDKQRGLEAIERNARAQAQIINDLLDMSRIISGKIHLEVQVLHLHEVITSAVEAVRPSAEAKRIKIRTMLDSGIGATRGDPNRLQQVLWNLLSNAVKFTPTGGSIQIILERVNSHVEIVIEDTGIGIAPDFLPHVFDRFRQADASTTRRYGGLGLGLSIVKNLVELHGGAVRVKSPGPNQGSTFIVSLPVSTVRVEQAARLKQPALVDQDIEAIELPRLDGTRVLIIDDEPDGRQLVARILEGRGATVVCVGSANEGVETLQREAFDILLSDIGMPDVDGYEFMRLVRSLEGNLARIPAIAVTAYARAEDRQRSLLAGYQMHIAKPVDARELVAAIASLLKVSRG